MVNFSKLFAPNGWIIPINLSNFILSLTMSTYLGSKIFKGTDVFGKRIKLLKGNTGIVLGKFFFPFYLSKNIKYNNLDKITIWFLI